MIRSLQSTLSLSITRSTTTSTTTFHSSMLFKSIGRNLVSDAKTVINGKEHYRIAVLPGDGIGAEVTEATQRVLEKIGFPAVYTQSDIGFEYFKKHKTTALPQKTIDVLNNSHGAIFGAVSSPSHRVEGYSSPIVALRKIFKLHANIRPVVSSPLQGVREGIDMVIIRENTECLYVKQEKIETGPDGKKTAVASRVITEDATRRIATTAFEFAKDRPRKKLTIVHKANVLAVTDGLFRETVLEVAKDPKYSSVKVEEQLVDSCVYRMFLDPQSFDVLVAPNMYGDIISDAAAAVVGGLGVVPSANMGVGFAVAEPVHGSAPDIVGKQIANPIATIRAAGLLMNCLGENDYYTALEEAVQLAIANNQVTPDLKGKLTTTESADAIAKHATEVLKRLRK